MGGFSRFDGWQKSERSVPCQRYSNSSLVKAQVALMSLGKTSFADDADTVIRLYHEHAAHEQFHSELKTDLDVERLPSGSFAVNELVLALATLSFNILRIIGGIALEVHRASPCRWKFVRPRGRGVNAKSVSVRS